MNMQQTTKTCRRILARKKIAGVCAGLAERFDLPVWLTRVLTLLVFLKFPMMTLMAYGLCAVLWPKQ
jgi:phage shock protein C